MRYRINVSWLQFVPFLLHGIWWRNFQALAFNVPTFIPTLRQDLSRLKQIVAASSRLRSTASPEDPDTTSSRSVGDVVQGLHGSKYQFQESGSSSLEGQRFAESLYASGMYQGDRRRIESTLKNEPIPNWAIQWQERFTPRENAPQLKVVVVSKDETASSPTTTVQIRNDERSWEKFYTFVMLVDDDHTKLDASYLIKVSPKLGMLAPRGTITDEFSETVELQIQAKVAADLAASETLWLLVGTEAEKWVYRLV
jgi:hypothetical protein